ncbi:MAG TPA: hypothetical protein VGK40_10005 [Verrucomicrobiae bacterium]|jgi:hypothetical protein
MKHGVYFPIVWLTVSLLVALPLLAGQVVPFTVAQLTERSQVILHAIVRSRTVQRDPQGRIYTKIELDVSDVWKGAGVTNRFLLVQAGGILGEEGMAVEGQSEFAIGEEIVAFMVLNQRGEGVILGLSQGTFRVSRDPASGERFVHNPFHGGPPPGQIRGQLQPGSAGARLSLAELRSRVQGGRP